MAFKVMVASPAPTVNVLPLNVPLPVVFTGLHPVYCDLFVQTTTVADAVDPHNVIVLPYSTLIDIEVVPVPVHPVAATDDIPFPALTVIV